MCIAFVCLLSPVSGCGWLRAFQPVKGPVAPVVLAETPSLNQVMDAVNQNTARVRTYSTRGARISSPGYPALRANIAVERPRRFRLWAETSLTGPEVDLGSNEDLFWFWVRRAQPPALYYSRHDQFAASTAKQLLPIQPSWLIDALGLPTFEANAQHTGPRLVKADRLEIRSNLPPEEGSLVKITLLDAKRGTVMEQHLYTEQGERLASAIASAHRYDPATQITLPTHVEVQVPRAQLTLKIDVGDTQVNQATGDPRQMFGKPTYEGYTEVDLGAMRLPLAAPSGPNGPTGPPTVPVGAGPSGMAPVGGPVGPTPGFAPNSVPANSAPPIGTSAEQSPYPAYQQAIRPSRLPRP